MKQGAGPPTPDPRGAGGFPAALDVDGKILRTARDGQSILPTTSLRCSHLPHGAPTSLHSLGRASTVFPHHSKGSLGTAPQNGLFRGPKMAQMGDDKLAWSSQNQEQP